jgi:hypothetical protein
VSVEHIHGAVISSLPRKISAVYMQILGKAVRNCSGSKSISLFCGKRKQKHVSLLSAPLCPCKLYHVQPAKHISRSNDFLNPRMVTLLETGAPKFRFSYKIFNLRNKIASVFVVLVCKVQFVSLTPKSHKRP